MGARRPPKPRLSLADAVDPSGLGAFMLGFLDSLRVKNYSAHSVQTYENSLALFLEWGTARGLTRPGEITRPILQAYQRHLFHYRKPSGDPLSFRSQHHRLAVVRGYFKWLARQNVILSNPASDLELPRLEQRLPRHVLTPAEVEALLAVPDPATPLGLRDRALLETFYSTGMRRMEAAGLSVFDLDVARGTVMIRQGKGKKDRVVPIGARALGWIRRYLDTVRPGLVVEPDGGALFLTVKGEAFTLSALTELVRNAVTAAGLGKRGACHLLRHSMATAMLENGADIRYLQEILGHAELTTTQIYTRVSITKLKAVHTATHPAERPDEDDEDDAAELALIQRAAEEE